VNPSEVLISDDEGVSRLLETGWPIHHVQEMLGHGSLERLPERMRRSDNAKTRCTLVAIAPRPTTRVIT
jgi:hypothetical protein